MEFAKQVSPFAEFMGCFSYEKQKIEILQDNYVSSYSETLKYILTFSN